MRAAAQFVEMRPCLAAFGDTMAQGPETRQDGKGQQEDHYGPEVIPGQSLGRNVKYRRECHLMDLLSETLFAPRSNDNYRPATGFESR
jgi:hypothetical protein